MPDKFVKLFSNGFCFLCLSPVEKRENKAGHGVFELSFVQSLVELFFLRSFGFPSSSINDDRGQMFN